MNDNVPYSLQLKHKGLLKKGGRKKKRGRVTGHRQRGMGEEEDRNMVSRGGVGAIDDLFRESPLRSLGPRYTFIYRRYL